MLEACDGLLTPARIAERTVAGRVGRVDVNEHFRLATEHATHIGRLSSHFMCLFLHSRHPYRDFVCFRRGIFSRILLVVMVVDWGVGWMM